jgi:hypothetical protein
MNYSDGARMPLLVLRGTRAALSAKTPGPPERRLRDANLLRFTAAVVVGLISCILYVVLTDRFCPAEGARRPSFTIDDLQVYQGQHGTKENGQQYRSKNVDASISSTFASSKADAKEAETHNQSKSQQQHPSKWITIVCDVKAADIALVFFTFCLVLVTWWLVGATVGLKDVTAELVRHGTISNRAHVSGGANHVQTETGEPFLVITLNNYGASPAFIGTIAATICKRSDLDVAGPPEWQIKQWKGYVFGAVAGQATDVVLRPQFDKVIIGRIWYRDIFKSCHSAGFALEINGLRAVGKSSYWEERDEDNLGPAEPKPA